MTVSDDLDPVVFGAPLVRAAREPAGRASLAAPGADIRLCRDPGSSIAGLAEALRPVFEGMSRLFAEVSDAWPQVAGLVRVLAEDDAAHRARMRTVHREYSRRYRARRRRRG